MLLGWVGPNIRKTKIQTHQHAPLSTDAFGDHPVIGAAEPLFVHRVGFETPFAEKGCGFSREVLVNLKFQALTSKGKSTVPSRVSSAA